MTDVTQWEHDEQRAMENEIQHLRSKLNQLVNEQQKRYDMYAVAAMQALIPIWESRQDFDLVKRVHTLAKNMTEYLPK